MEFQNECWSQSANMLPRVDVTLPLIVPNKSIPNDKNHSTILVDKANRKSVASSYRYAALGKSNGEFMRL